MDATTIAIDCDRDTLTLAQKSSNFFDKQRLHGTDILVLTYQTTTHVRVVVSGDAGVQHDDDLRVDMSVHHADTGERVTGGDALTRADSVLTVGAYGSARRTPAITSQRLAAHWMPVSGGHRVQQRLDWKFTMHVIGSKLSAREDERFFLRFSLVDRDDHARASVSSPYFVSRSRPDYSSRDGFRHAGKKHPCTTTTTGGGGQRAKRPSVARRGVEEGLREGHEHPNPVAMLLDAAVKAGDMMRIGAEQAIVPSPGCSSSTGVDESHDESFR